MAIGDNAIRRLTVIATDQGLTALNTKMRENDRLADQIAASHTRMATATEAADRRLTALHRNMNARGALGGLGVGGAVGAAANTVAPYAAAGAAVIGTIAAMNAVYQHGADLLERYADAQREVDRPDLVANLEGLTKLQRDTISAAQVQYATSLGVRLQDANFQIEKFFKTSLDITDPALRLQSMWVGIVEAIARATGYLDGMISKFDKIPAPVWHAALNAVPVVGAVAGAARGANYFLGSEPPPPPTADQLMGAAKGKLGSALDVSYIGREGAPDPVTIAGAFNFAITKIVETNNGLKEQKDSVNDVRTAWDRAQESLGKNIAMQEAEASAVGKTAAEHARLRAEAQLLEAGLRTGMTEAAIKASDAYKTLGDRAGAAAEALAKANLQKELSFNRDQRGRNPVEQEVASRLRGAGLSVDMDSPEAGGIRRDIAAKIKEQLASSDPIKALEREMEGLRSLLKSGELDWDSYADRAMRANANVASGMFGMGAQLATSLGTIFNEQKVSAYAAAVLNTAEAITKSIATYGATPWGLAAAGVAAAAGAAQIATIQRASRSGGGSAPTAPAAAAPLPSIASSGPADTSGGAKQAINLTINGRYVDADQVRELIEQINEYSGDGGTRIVMQ